MTVEPARPCNYGAPTHRGPTRRYAPGWRCTMHTPEATTNPDRHAAARHEGRPCDGTCQEETR